MTDDGKITPRAHKEVPESSLGEGWERWAGLHRATESLFNLHTTIACFGVHRPWHLLSTKSGFH